MTPTMSIPQIAEATGIDAERLRYVIDQKLLPGQTDSSSSGRGTARQFSIFSAFGLACAALMISAGMRRSTVMKCMELLCSANGEFRPPISDIPLIKAFKKRSVAMLEIGDKVNIRMYGSEDYRKRKLDYAWRQVATGANLANYEPMVVIGINVGRLRKCFEP